MCAKTRGVVILLLLVMVAAACGGNQATVAPAASTQGATAPELGAVKLNAHPASLEGKTVVLRWNGKPNGDGFLNRVAELLTQQAPGVKVIKLWEVDQSTAATSETAEVSQKVVQTIASYKPDLVIASQCD